MNQSSAGATPGPAGVPAGRRLRALLLNATHEPLAVLAARRALVLVLAGKAECILERDDGGSFHSPTVALVVPAVLRLHRYVRIPYSPAVAVSRAGILRRDHRRCAYCGTGADTIDHVVPRSRGGTHSWDNCVACCHRCNTRKADRLLSELGWQLRTVPGVPRRVGSAGLWFGEDADPAWGPWLASAA
ncbi:HNH endonuclease [Nakamurella endophytica]|uniref:HNH endonuclease n=1 Tax=Nakamurella endophytica TaxID=1748367 RepID=A0A917WI92_9ACTN|nr:HNH endonuclease [Nakamurella endophytica]GGM06931.1 HNH endonuclease [Nakamurella endophytica]